MNFSIIKKPIFEMPHDTCEGPFKLINSTHFLYVDDSLNIKCINMKTNKITFVLKEEDLADPSFGLVNKLKLLVKTSESKVILYQINKTLSELEKIKVLNINGFQIARSLYKDGYIIGCENNILIYDFKDELQLSIPTKYNFFGFDYHVTAPFEIELKNKNNNLLVLPMGHKTDIFLRNQLKKVITINSIINDALDMDDGNIILACEEKLVLVNLKNYMTEYEVECPQIEEKLEYWDIHNFSDIFKYKDNIFTTISGMSDQNGNNYLISFWKYNLDKSNNKLELIQSLEFNYYDLMMDKEKLLIMSDHSIIRLSIKEIKGKAKNIIKTTTSSDYNKKMKEKKEKEKSGNKSKKNKKSDN